MSYFYHGDVLGRLPPTIPLYFLPCRDRIVYCQVRLHVLVAGSFHPSAATLLETLGQSPDGLTLAEIAETTGALGEPGLRFTSELIARLCAAHHAERVPNLTGRFRVIQTRESSLRPKTEVVSHKLSYLPRSGRLAWKLDEDEKLAGANVRWWRPPDDGMVYAPDALSSGIERACPGFVKDRRNLFPKWPRNFSIEELERDKLLLRNPELINADADNVTLSRGVIVHRCYFHPTSYDSAWVRVYSGDEPVPESGYSAYFQNAVKSQSGFLKSMLEAAEILRR